MAEEIPPLVETELVVVADSTPTEARGPVEAPCAAKLLSMEEQAASRNSEAPMVALAAEVRPIPTTWEVALEEDTLGAVLLHRPTAIVAAAVDHILKRHPLYLKQGLTVVLAWLFSPSRQI